MEPLRALKEGQDGTGFERRNAENAERSSRSARSASRGLHDRDQAEYDRALAILAEDFPGDIRVQRGVVFLGWPSCVGVEIAHSVGWFQLGFRVRAE